MQTSRSELVPECFSYSSKDDGNVTVYIYSKADQQPSKPNVCSLVGDSGIL